MISRGMQVYLEYKNAHRCKNNIFFREIMGEDKKQKILWARVQAHLL